MRDLITVKTKEQVQQRQQTPLSKKQLFPSFEHRYEGTEAVINCASNNLKAYNDNLENPIAKQMYSVITITGGSGSGKTRAAREIAGILRKSKELNACFKKTCEFYLDFSNGYKIFKFENLEPSCITGVRLFHSALVDGIPFEKFLYTNAQHITNGLFRTEAVLQEISQVYRPLLAIPQEDPLPIVVIFDEFQCTFEDCKELQDLKRWKQIAKSVAEYMCTSMSANTFLKRDKLLLLTTIAGTLTRSDVSFGLTSYTSVLFPLPCFPLATALKLAREAQIPMQYLDENNSEYNRFWYLMGLVPRCLEYSCKIILNSKQQDLPAQQLFNLVQRELDSLYRLSETYTEGKDKELLQYTMTGVYVENEEWIQDLQRKGQVFLQGQPRKILLPHPVFYKLTLSFGSILPTELIHVSKEMFNWYTFEKLDMRIIVKRRAFATRIEELFPGAHGRDAIKELDILKCNSARYLMETKFYVEGTRAAPIVSAADECIETERGTIKEARDKFVFQAKANQPLIDGRLFINGPNKENIVCFLQYKYSAKPEVDKEEQVKVSPLAWYNAIAPAIQHQYKDYLVVFVYITNANIPKKAKDAVAKCKNLLVVEQSCAQAYFAPNILPFYATVQAQDEGKEEEEAAAD